MTHYIFFILFISSRSPVFYVQDFDIILTYFKDFKTYFEKNMAANDVIMRGTGIEVIQMSCRIDLNLTSWVTGRPLLIKNRNNLWLPSEISNIF